MKYILKLNLVTQAIGLVVAIPMTIYSYMVDDRIMWEALWGSLLILFVATNFSIFITPYINRFLDD